MKQYIWLDQQPGYEASCGCAHSLLQYTLNALLVVELLHTIQLITTFHCQEIFFKVLYLAITLPTSDNVPVKWCNVDMKEDLGKKTAMAMVFCRKLNYLHLSEHAPNCSLLTFSFHCHCSYFTHCSFHQNVYPEISIITVACFLPKKIYCTQIFTFKKWNKLLLHMKTQCSDILYVCIDLGILKLDATEN